MKVARLVWIVEVRRTRGRRWYPYDVGTLRDARTKAKAYRRLAWIGETRVVAYVPRVKRRRGPR